MKSVINKGYNKMIPNVSFMFYQLKVWISSVLSNLFDIAPTYKFRVVFDETFRYKEKIKTTIHPFLSFSTKGKVFSFAVRYNNSKDCIEGFSMWQNGEDSGIDRLNSRNNKGYNISIGEPYVLSFVFGQGRPFMKIEREDPKFTSFGRARAGFTINNSMPILDGPHFVGKTESDIKVNLEMV